MNDQPLPSFHFQVDWGATRMGFQEVTGLDLETEVIEYREGNFKEASPLKIPGLKKYGDVTLRRGIVDGDNEIFEWFTTNGFGQAEPRDVTVSLLNDDREPVVSWKITNAWIRKITGPDLDAQGNCVAIEEMTLACDGISIAND